VLLLGVWHGWSSTINTWCKRFHCNVIFMKYRYFSELPHVWNLAHVLWVVLYLQTVYHVLIIKSNKMHYFSTLFW
jgi:hypothetical protein